MNRLPFNVVYFRHLGKRRVVQSREATHCLPYSDNIEC